MKTIGIAISTTEIALAHWTPAGDHLAVYKIEGQALAVSFWKCLVSEVPKLVIASQPRILLASADGKPREVLGPELCLISNCGASDILAGVALAAMIHLGIPAMVGKLDYQDTPKGRAARARIETMAKELRQQASGENTGPRPLPTFLSCLAICTARDAYEHLREARRQEVAVQLGEQKP